MKMSMVLNSLHGNWEGGRTGTEMRRQEHSHKRPPPAPRPTSLLRLQLHFLHLNVLRGLSCPSCLPAHRADWAPPWHRALCEVGAGRVWHQLPTDMRRPALGTLGSEVLATTGSASAVPPPGMKAHDADLQTQEAEQQSRKYPQRRSRFDRNSVTRS